MSKIIFEATFINEPSEKTIENYNKAIYEILKKMKCSK